MINRDLIAVTLLLMMLLFASGCGNTQRTVILGNGFTPTPSSEADSSSDGSCEEEAATCVAKISSGKTTDEMIEFGNVEEGEKFEISTELEERADESCQAGLNAIMYTRVSGGECVYPTCPCYVCVKCPDGECGKGENECNCPQDCK